MQHASEVRHRQKVGSVSCVRWHCAPLFACGKFLDRKTANCAPVGIGIEDLKLPAIPWVFHHWPASIHLNTLKGFSFSEICIVVLPALEVLAVRASLWGCLVALCRLLFIHVHVFLQFHLTGWSIRLRFTQRLTASFRPQCRALVLAPGRLSFLCHQAQSPIRLSAGRKVHGTNSK